MLLLVAGWTVDLEPSVPPGQGAQTPALQKVCRGHATQDEPFVATKPALQAVQLERGVVAEMELWAHGVQAVTLTLLTLVKVPGAQSAHELVSAT